jgi:hypothetical protein
MPKLLGWTSEGMNSHLAIIAERHGGGIRGHYIGSVKLPLCKWKISGQGLQGSSLYLTHNTIGLSVVKQGLTR